jgi:hypothetical protein
LKADFQRRFREYQKTIKSEQPGNPEIGLIDSFCVIIIIIELKKMQATPELSTPQPPLKKPKGPSSESTVAELLPK